MEDAEKLVAESVVNAPVLGVVDPIGVFWIDVEVTEPFSWIVEPSLVS